MIWTCEKCGGDLCGLAFCRIEPFIPDEWMKDRELLSVHLCERCRTVYLRFGEPGTIEHKDTMEFVVDWDTREGVSGGAHNEKE